MEQEGEGGVDLGGRRSGWSRMGMAATEQTNPPLGRRQSDRPPSAGQSERRGQRGGGARGPMRRQGGAAGRRTRGDGFGGPSGPNAQPRRCGCDRSARRIHGLRRTSLSLRGWSQLSLPKPRVALGAPVAPSLPSARRIVVRVFHFMYLFILILLPLATRG